MTPRARKITARAFWVTPRGPWSSKHKATDTCRFPGGTPMQMFDIQGIEIHASVSKVFEFLREPGNLPRWAHAFESAGGGRARLKTPAGALEIGLTTTAESRAGTVDWKLEFSDG